MKNYYHVIEDCGYGDIGTHGCYENIKEAKEEAARLQDYFPNHHFYVYFSDSDTEPEFITL